MRWAENLVADWHKHGFDWFPGGMESMPGISGNLAFANIDASCTWKKVSDAERELAQRIAISHARKLLGFPE
jgi:hypothetical protein